MLALHSRLGTIGQCLIHYRIHSSQQVGFGAVALSENLTLRQRLREARLVEPGKHLAGAAELTKLEEHMVASSDAASLESLPHLRDKIRFFEGRGDPRGGRLSQDHQSSVEREELSAL